MPLLSTPEALRVTDSFLSSLYGDDIFRRWKELKDEMKFITEREYVSWLIDVANHYKNEDESQQLSQETDTNQFTTSNVHGIGLGCIRPTRGEESVRHTNLKSEEGLEHYNQGQDQVFETPVSEYSHLSSRQDTRNSKNNNEQFTVDTKLEGTISFNEQSSGTLQVDDYKYEQSYYDEDERMVDVAASGEIILSSDEDDGGVDEGPSGAIDDGDGYLAASSMDSPNDNKRLACPHCSYSTDRGGNMKKHISAIHERRKPFPCQYCSYMCTERNKLKRHLINKHGFTSKYRCDTCGKYFQLPAQRDRHMEGCKVTS